MIRIKLEEKELPEMAEATVEATISGTADEIVALLRMQYGKEVNKIHPYEFILLPDGTDPEDVETMYSKTNYIVHDGSAHDLRVWLV